MKLPNLFSKLFLLIAMAFMVSGLTSPPVKSQALIHYDTLKAGDSVKIFTIDPYGDDVTITFVDSSDAVTDSICVYEILPQHYDTVGATLIKEGAQFDSLKITGSTIFTPGQGAVTTYRFINRQPYKIKIVRRNQHLNINHNTYVIVRARTKYYNSLPGRFMTETAYVGYMPEQGTIINDKIVYLRGAEKYNYILPNPLSYKAPDRARSFNKISNSNKLLE